ncbi:MAG: DUF1015 domain-containing protein [Candidatus Omnitrophica bacterium]|nr:DUF1015 domain-containing protein [Candidatus Omnitrophota bacterium]
MPASLNNPAMTKIAAFRGVIYNQEKIAELAKVVCPPYDVISPARQEYYHQLHPHNLIHILLGRDTPGEDKYKRSAGYFKDWFKKDIFIQDQKPAIYFYSHQYSVKGEKRTRLGFIACLYLEDDNPSVFRHEHTRLEPKEDRLKLLRETKANLSPIFVLFPDKKRIVQRLYEQQMKDNLPFIDITDEEKNIHKLWRLDAPDILKDIQQKMQGEHIFIADGHHRYEVACTYRDEMKKKVGNITGQEGFNYLMAYFTNTESKGLTIFAIHRLIRLESQLDFADFLAHLKGYFDIEEVQERIKFFFLMDKCSRAEHVIGMYRDKKYYLLRLKNVKILDKEMPDGSKAYRSLDVSILNSIVLKEILKLDLEDKEKISFSANVDELIERVNNDSSCIGFFLNPVKIPQIIAVALNGERMPVKSTYFYPKVLSGLVINKLE